MAIKVAGQTVVDDNRRITGVTDDLPSIRPTLNLDFANSKTLDPRIDFTRSSTATYWDGKTTAKAEENLVRWAESFGGGTGWTISYTGITSNSTTAPDGTTTASKLYEAVSGVSPKRINRNDLPATSGDYVINSVYAKAGERDTIGVYIYDGVSWIANTFFNLTSGTVGTVVSGSASITDVGNGWYRCTVWEQTTRTANHWADYRIILSDETDQYEGDGSSGLYIWGAQFETREAGTVTAYTPTTGTPITRYQPVLQTASANQPRIDHDPVTGECKGLLIEESRTNLVTNSVIPTAYDVNGISIQANAAVAPDGTVSAALLTSDSTLDGHYAYYTNFTRPTGVITYSIYVKPLSMSRGYIWFGSGSASLPNQIIIDTSDWSVIYTGGASDYSVTEAGNGWYRISTTGTATTTGTSQVYLGFANSSTSPTGDYVGDASDRMLIWGAQVEAGSFPTSYIPTSGSQVTRAGDSASMTGTNFSDWYIGNDWSAYISFTTSSTNTYQGAMSFNNGTANERVIFSAKQASDGIALNVRGLGNSTQAYMTTTDNYANDGETVQRIAARVGLDDFGFSGNGTTAQTDTSGVVPQGIDRLGIGSSVTGSTEQMTGHVRKIAYYPKALSNATLQAMTEE